MGRKRKKASRGFVRATAVRAPWETWNGTCPECGGRVKVDQANGTVRPHYHAVKELPSGMGPCPGAGLRVIRTPVDRLMRPPPSKPVVKGPGVIAPSSNQWVSVANGGLPTLGKHHK